MGAYHSVSPGWATTNAGWTGSFGPLGTYGNQAYNLRGGRYGVAMGDNWMPLSHGLATFDDSYTGLYF